MLIRSFTLQILIISITLLIICPAHIVAQILPSKEKIFVVSPERTVIQLDLLTEANSIVVSHADSLISPNLFLFEMSTGKLFFQWPMEWTSLPVELKVRWKYRPISLSQQYSLMRILERSVDQDTVIAFARQRDEFNQKTLGSRLQSGGSLTRGIVIGNNRDPGLESGLRFDLQGYITDDVYLTASLSDQNSIIQPDGTTQSLREFDQVYIRLSTPGASLQLGDIDVRFDRSALARLQRRLQGADFVSETDRYGSNKATASVIRGTYRTMEFNGRESIQGPYRLTGVNNETFIIVVAGTEQVYLDGRLLIRGEDNDYIIDYGLGEITFTSRRLIRRSHRIRVEYQYLSNNYNRTLTAVETDDHWVAGNRLSIGATFIREADNSSFVDGIGLSEQDIDIIRNAGTDFSRMRSSGIDSVGFRQDANVILYTKVDTLIQNEIITYYRHIPGNPSSVYRIQFNNVGSNNGSYRRLGSSLNGIIYEWVGENNGDFEPFRQLSGPRLTNILALRGKARIYEDVTFSSEWSVSSLDVNRLSDQSTTLSDHMIVTGLSIKNRDIYIGMMDLSATLEYKGKNFTFFDRVRDVEFNRKWDIRNIENSEDVRGEIISQVKFSDQSLVNYTFQQLNRTDRNGIRHDVNLDVNETDYPFLQSQIGILRSENPELASKTNWDTYNAGIGYGLNIGSSQLIPELQFSAEIREESGRSNAEHITTGFRFEEFTPGLKYINAFGTRISVGYSSRTEYEMMNGSLNPSYQINSPRTEIEFNISNSWSSVSRIAYQKSNPTDEYKAVTGATEVKGVAIRSANDINLLRKVFDNNILYDVSTESRSLLQETYLEVGSEFGQFIWIDLNNDGIQQIEEFFSEQNPNEGTFIKQLLPSDQVLPVISLRTRWRLTFDPIHLFSNWRNEGFLGRFLANLTYTSLLQIREQNETDRLEDIYLLKSSAFRNAENTINGSITWNQDIQFFRRIPEWNLRLRRDQRESLNRQFSGLEESVSLIRSVSVEYRAIYNLIIQNAFTLTSKKLFNEGIANRNFEISGWELEPGIRFINGREIQLGLTTVYGIKEDVGAGRDINVEQIRIAGDGILYVADRLQINFRTEFRRMNIEGDAGVFNVFELTEGVGEGNSWLWNTGIQWRNSDWIRTSFQYDGRTITNRNPIQTLRLTVTATF
jgi:hypothetical protein